MAERSEVARVPANLMRTMPYTAYVAVGSYAVVCWSRDAAWLELGLLLGEIANAVAKSLLKKVAGPKAGLLRRPEGAADSGIYPQHCPRASSSSGMPSGHSQTSAFLAIVLSHLVVRRSGEAVPWRRCAEPTETCAQPSRPRAELLVPLGYIWLVAVLVMMSRTRFAGPLAVCVDGRAVAHHTVPQVLVGAAVGCLLGEAAVVWHSGGDGGPWVGLAAAVLALVATAAWLEARCQGARGGDADADGGSDGDKSRDVGSIEASADVQPVDPEASERAGAVELPRVLFEKRTRLTDLGLPGVIPEAIGKCSWGRGL
uniref:Phosphatidic acid phosphatase type 2/haloperoxidase domain-containing protein n=1 Tax=Alexandrium monilatum TaxID=311494 RepID=A0A7S4V384_9DINO|mmetsp:Transcript_39562/g.118407  ORF Transcript_39562/g.118407 Transcript_39562/m.118407 type:complete len:314 (+) Transcript_39562:67-1008(+)